MPCSSHPLDFITFAKENFNDQVKEDEMGRAWEEEDFDGKVRRKEPQERPDVGGRIILKWILER
jgi:hypothetical protein